jgi:RimJ/RimL family protein N-acetyltransferase
LEPGARQTQRLIVRPPLPEDGDDYHAHFSKEPIERWLRPPPLPPFDADVIDRLLADDRRHWELHGFGPWVLVEQESGRFAGRGGLAWTTVEDRLAVELPWTIEPRLQGRGLATEAALAATAWASELGLDELIALTLPTNRASQRVAEKAGLVREGECEHAGLRHLLFRVRLEPAGDPTASRRGG